MCAGGPVCVRVRACVRVRVRVCVGKVVRRNGHVRHAVGVAKSVEKDGGV